MKKEFWKTDLKEKTDVVLLDGYIDEPSLLGVPPYISPEPRLIAGVLEENDLDWEYVTADEYRNTEMPRCKILIVHGGVTVPGKYLSGKPLTKEETEKIGKTNCETFLGGPLARYEKIKNYDHIVKKDLSAYLNDFLNHSPKDRWANLVEKEKWLFHGAKVVEKHPMYPDPLIPEISLYKGCVRFFTGGCSFCSEPNYGKPKFRKKKNVAREIETLNELGIKNFRIGGQSCTLSYNSKKLGEKETPTPQPSEIKQLFETIRKKTDNIKVLHLDNANPSVIAKYPEKSKEILKIFKRYTTAGNVLALGLESADPNVIEKNNLNSTPSQTEEAVKIINEVGAERGENGMPKILPGINFLAGLKGETKETFKINFKFLKELTKEDYLLRRINIRQVLPHQGNFDFKNPREFKKFKKKVRKEIDRPLLRKILPEGTVLKDVLMEKREGKTTFGRQVGTYPLLVGIKYPLKIGEYYNVKIYDYGKRSVTGVHYPLNPEDTKFEHLKSVPGVGEKRAAKIFRKQPSNREEFLNIFEDKKRGEEIIDYFSFE